MYKLLALFGVFLRQYYLPNPLLSISSRLEFLCPEIPSYILLEGLNFIANYPLYLISYLVTGIYYKRASNPVFGSILYMFFFFIHSKLLSIISVFYFSPLPTI